MSCQEMQLEIEGNNSDEIISIVKQTVTEMYKEVWGSTGIFFLLEKIYTCSAVTSILSDCPGHTGNNHRRPSKYSPF